MMSKTNGRFWGSLVLIAVAPLSRAAGYGYYCAPLDRRVMNADTIVVGSTHHVETEDVGAELEAVTYRFEVTQVLKGQMYKAGDTIVQRYEPNQRVFGPTPFPWEEGGEHVVFANKRENQEVRFACSEPIDTADLPRMKRMITVHENPPAFMGSDQEVDITTVLAWISRTYVAHDGRDGTRPDWTRQAKPGRTTVVAYLKKHARNSNTDLAVRALEILSWLRPPEVFDVFVEALGSKNDDAMICLGALGLRRIGDARAVPLLIDRLVQYRSNQEERRRRMDLGEEVEPRQHQTRGSAGLPRYWHPDNELIGAINSFDDPRVTNFQMGELERVMGGQRGRVTAPDDPRAVELLLSLTWRGNHHAMSALQQYGDPRILEQARERKYDHPFAPTILAELGDPQAEEFMLRLIRQGHRAGARWAAVTRNESAKPDLIRSMAYRTSGPHPSNNDAYALGRMRAFELIPGLLDVGRDFDLLVNAALFLVGLADLPLYGRDDGCRGVEADECRRVALREIAAREQWSEREVRLADALADTVEHPLAQPRRPGWLDPWSPPESLPDMPDPRDKEVAAVYMKRHLERCRTALREGSIEDKFKILDAAAQCGAKVLDGDLAVRLLHDSDEIVRGYVWSALARKDLALTIPQIERWAFCGDYQSTSSALRYMGKQPDAAYAAIVNRILHQGRHLFDENLFHTIIENNAAQCADLLTAYLTGQHITLRINAAATLALLGDETGLEVLRETRQHAPYAGRQIDREYIERALELLE